MELSFIIVDDSELDCFITRKFIEHTDKDIKVTTYQSGKLAMEQIRHDADNKVMPLTIVLLDLRMPTMNGFQFVDQFDKLPVDIKKKYRIHVLSSTRNTNDIQRILTHAAVHSMIDKPLTREKMEVFLDMVKAKS
jgi:CheY-like chemotaxis protein